jgi:hypothetical protein
MSAANEHICSIKLLFEAPFPAKDVVAKDA